ncbi:MAG: orotidine 5'-phosphate decarboxylase / HUMPS family protein, partial [Fusobacteriaceae bacterium]
MQARDRIIIALDYSTGDDAKKIVEKLGDTATVYKVGLELFLNTKGEILDYLNSKNKKIFLDLKFHDIPNTTAMASIFAAKQKCFMFNIHASGGKKMM